jgi:hypothetical protein
VKQKPIEPIETIKVTDRRRFPFVMASRSLFKKGLSCQAMSTYMGLLFYERNKSGSVGNIGTRDLADKAAISQRSLIRALAELEKKQVIRIKAGKAKYGKGNFTRTTNEYTLLDIDNFDKD